MDTYTLTLTRQDVDQLLAALGHRPFNEVVHMINGIFTQTQQQDAARAVRAAAAESALQEKEKANG